MKTTMTLTIAIGFMVAFGGLCLAKDELPVSHDRQIRLDAMKAGGANNTLTLLPMRLAGKPFDRLAEVVGYILEQKGLNEIELGTAVPSEAAGDMAGLAAAVQECVKKNSIPTAYTLYAEFNGDRRTGLNELRAVLVDRKGDVVWADRLTENDAAVKDLGSREPMMFCVLLCDQLAPALGLSGATASTAKPGKMAALMDKRSGLPSAEERAALPQRLREMKQQLPKATLAVFSLRSGTSDGAANLARLINQAALCQATAEPQPIALNVSHSDPNELKALWGLARAFRTYLKTHPPTADYALCADYAFNPANVDQGFVHFVVCDRAGDWVIADMQNSDHPEYRAMEVNSAARCDELLAKRLAGYLQ